MFAMFGPYHIARINAAAINDNIVGIEVSATSNIYAWHKLLGTDSFQRVTLFSDASISQESNGEIRAKVHALLSKHQPDVVVVPGWASSWANSMLGWAMDNRVPAVLMSESQAIDFDRVWWREWIKHRVVGIYSAAIAGGRRHVQYLEQLGMPTERITTGYDVVDNEQLAAGARRARGRSEQLRRELGLPKTARFVEKKICLAWSRPLLIIARRPALMPGALSFLATARYVRRSNRISANGGFRPRSCWRVSNNMMHYPVTMASPARLSTSAPLSSGGSSSMRRQLLDSP